MVKDQKFESHKSDRVVKRIPESMVTFWEALDFEHLCQNHRTLGDLTASQVRLSYYELGLEALEGVGEELSEDYWDVYCCYFLQEGV